MKLSNSAFRAAWLCDKPIFSGVIRLHHLANPSTIARLVVSVIVNPVESHSFWAPTHVLKESGVVIAPSVTHSYTAPSISIVIRNIWVKASAFRMSPRFVFFCSAFTMKLRLKSKPVFSDATA